MSSILVTCGNKSSAEEHYLPALRAGGWAGPMKLAAAREPLPSLEDIRGLLLTGGYDMHPRCWDPEEPLHPAAEPDEARDELEMALVRRALDLGWPILGICRGEQVLNVALGGSLVQDLPSFYGCGETLHNHGSSAAPETWHEVEVAPDSRLAGLLGRTRLQVNSRHHQGVGRLAPGLRAAAWHPGTLKDGLPFLEGVESADPGRWIVGVQWHPENLLRLEGEPADAALGLFRGFVRQVMA